MPGTALIAYRTSLVQFLNRTQFCIVFEFSGGWVVDSNALLDWHSMASVLKRVRQSQAIAVLSGQSPDATGPTAVLEPVVANSALQVSAGGTRRPPCAAAFPVSRETLNRSVKERARVDLTEPSMNCRHLRMKDFPLARYGTALDTSDQANLAAPVTD